MKAFKVYYSTGSKSTNMIVLAEHEGVLAEAVSNKDKDFRLDSTYSRIEIKYEIPFSNVMVEDLSVTELLALIKEC